MKKISFLLVILILIISGGFAWFKTNSSPVDQYDTKKRQFLIQKGMGVREIVNDLREQGLIKDPVVFFLIIKKLGLDNKIQAGEFYLSPSMSAEEIAQALQIGTFDVMVTIPEGKRAEEVAEILSEYFPQYNSTWEEKLKAHEGYLFPDTYTFYEEATIDQIITTMKDNFDTKYAALPSGQTDFSQEEIVTVASLVEREALFSEDRPLVASVILNRLGIGMKLDIDATVQYALGYNQAQQTWWKKRLSLNDLKIVSLYNTYTNPGLPPSPIANPGIESLKAVTSAPDTSYLYYVSDIEGRNHYAATIEEHNTNIEKYRVE